VVAEAEHGRVNGHASPGSAVFDALILLLGGRVIPSQPASSQVLL
jgi:hypothetical protein